jgi:hypothetical protein
VDHVLDGELPLDVLVDAVQHPQQQDPHLVLEERVVDAASDERVSIAQQSLPLSLEEPNDRGGVSLLR